MSTKKKAPSASAKARTSVKPGRNSKGVTSAKASTRSKSPASVKPSAVAKSGASRKPGKMETAIRKNVRDISATLGSMAPPGSPERVVAGVAAVAGGALIAGATLGAGPAALAGAAGYLAYKGLSGSKKKKSDAGSATRKRKARQPLDGLGTGTFTSKSSK